MLRFVLLLLNLLEYLLYLVHALVLGGFYEPLFL